MSLFETLSDSTRRYVDAMDSGQYDYSNVPLFSKEAEPEPEPAPTLSLYNLLEQGEVDLAIAATVFVQEADRLKTSLPKVSETLYAWANLFEAAIREKKEV